ncbi:MAG TPA: hypothetical protein VIY48_20010 [Candidatus Paceibacterota bacterium]
MAYLGRPVFGQSLYQPVIWDKLAQARGMGAPGTTEGAVPNYGGGGAGRGWNVETGASGAKFYTSPSGVTTSITPRADGHAGVGFYESAVVNPNPKSSSTERALNNLGDAFRAVQDYVAKNRPKSIGFSAATQSHQKLYDKVAPKLADQLGGTLVQGTKPGTYVIKFK